MHLECKLPTVVEDTWMNSKEDLRTNTKGPGMSCLKFISTESEFNNINTISSHAI